MVKLKMGIVHVVRPAAPPLIKGVDPFGQIFFGHVPADLRAAGAATLATSVSTAGTGTGGRAPSSWSGTGATPPAVPARFRRQ